MPYNLRKRPQPVAQAEVPVAKKRRVKTTASATAKKAVAKEEKQPVDEAPVEAKEEQKQEQELEQPIEEIQEQEQKPLVESKEKGKRKLVKTTTKQRKQPVESVDQKEPVESKDQKQPAASQHRRQLVFGIDSCGELGLGKIGVSKKNPIATPIEAPIQQVVCGPMHTLSLTADGQVYTYGCNDEGALGRPTDNDEELEATPTLVPIEGRITKATAGDSHSVVLTDDNRVFIWGNFRDEHGSAGLTPECDGRPAYSPIQIKPDTKFKDIASGSNHILLLDTQGTVYSFGVGAQGQLGRFNPDTVEGGENSITHTSQNKELFLVPQEVSLKDVDPQRPFVCDAIFAGNFSSFATNTDKKKNRLAAWGLNNYFQLGCKSTGKQLVQYFPKRSTFTCSTSMIQVACGQHHTLFLTHTGRVYSAGRHEYGMLGQGKMTKELCPAKSIECLGNTICNISAGINTSFAVDKSGKLFAWGMSGINLGLPGDDDLIEPTEVGSLKDKKVLSVSAGGSFTAVLVEDN